MQSLKNAVELYYLDNNEYPHDSDYYIVNSQFNTYLGKYLNSTIDINVIPEFAIVSGYPYLANTERYKIQTGGTEYPYHCGDTQSTRNPYIVYFRTANKDIADKIFPVFRYNSNNNQLVYQSTYYYCAFLPS